MSKALKLLTPYSRGAFQIKNRVAMSPMTRSRADTLGVPSDLAKVFYGQRASSGLLITEGTQPSKMGQGYARTPGIHSPEQIRAWKEVTDAVHRGNGKIFLQVMHAGRVAHRFNRQIDCPPVAPSAIRAGGTIWTDAGGLQVISMPRALQTDEIPAVIDEYRQATINALQAGFDGVELHSTSGYLPHQFLSTNANKRTDKYGGSVQNRLRFVLEALEAMVEGARSSEKVGIRISPGFIFNDITDDNPTETYTTLVKAINPLNLAYLHIQRVPNFEALPLLRPLFKGTLIATGGFDRDSGNQFLEEGKADIIAYGRSHIANPDLAIRFERNAPIATPDESTFYTPGAKGYTDYPLLKN